LIDLKNTLVIDIETISMTSQFEDLDVRLQKQWERKAGLIKNEDNLSPEELYFDRAAIYAEFGKIMCVAAGIFTNTEKGEPGLRIKAFYGKDEKEILLGFKELVDKKLNKNDLILCAHNGKEFDYPYLCRRYLINEIPLPGVLDISGKKPWEVNHIDTMELWKFGDRKNYTSLDLLAAIFNLPTSKDNIDGSMVNHVYYNDNDSDKIATYCKKDVLVTANLYLKLNALPIIPPQKVVYV
jgi:DNA polymerase elongation subunit (family B)